MITTGTFEIVSEKRIEVINVTPQVRNFVKNSGIGVGVCNVYLKHTSAGITIQEDEKLLKQDFEKYFGDIVHDDKDNPRYRHNCLGERPSCPATEPLNAGSHLSSALVGSSVSIQIKKGDIDLGTWQQILVIEYDGPRRREINMTIQGESGKSPIEQYLAEVKPLIVERMKSIFPFPEEDYPVMAEDIRKGMEAGKHVRGGLCVLISDALGGDRDRALSYAACIDGIHFGTLIHDDVMDGDTERRGKVSFWVKHGAKKAFVVGDRLSTLVKKRMLEMGHREASVYVETLDTLTSGVAQEINLGEFAVDLIAGRVQKNIYLKLIAAKTAVLFRTTAQFGAMAAKVRQEQEDKIARFGELLGMCFQIADDIDDVATLSKAERSKTDNIVSVLLMGLHYDSLSFRSLMRPVLRGKGFTDIIAKSNIQEKAMDDIKMKLSDANSYLNGVHLKEPYGQYLLDYGTWAVNAILAEQNLSLE